MLNKYSLENITKITINDKNYYLHNHMLQQLSFFDAIFDNEIDKSDIVIKWPVSDKLVILLFEILDGTSKRSANHCDNLSELLEFISFAKYLIPTENIIDHYICKYMENKDIVDFANECSKMPYDNELEYIFKICRFGLTNHIQNALNTINQLNLETSFKTNIIISCLRQPYQDAKLCGHIYDGGTHRAYLFKTVGFNPINGNHYYYFSNCLKTNTVIIDTITINKVKYTNCTLNGMPEIHNGNFIFCKMIANHECIVDVD